MRLHHVGQLHGTSPAPRGTPAAAGYSSSCLVGSHTGAVHTDLSISKLEPGGWTGLHLHSFESAVYVLAGTPVLNIDGHQNQLRTGDYALLPIGMPHGWANPSSGQARLLVHSTPQRWLGRPASGRYVLPARRLGGQRSRGPGQPLSRSLRGHAAAAGGAARGWPGAGPEPAGALDRNPGPAAARPSFLSLDRAVAASGVADVWQHGPALASVPAKPTVKESGRATYHLPAAALAPRCSPTPAPRSCSRPAAQARRHRRHPRPRRNPRARPTAST